MRGAERVKGKRAGAQARKVPALRSTDCHAQRHQTCTAVISQHSFRAGRPTPSTVTPPDAKPPHKPPCDSFCARTHGLPSNTAVHVFWLEGNRRRMNRHTHNHAHLPAVGDRTWVRAPRGVDCHDHQGVPPVAERKLGRLLALPPLPAIHPAHEARQGLARAKRELRRGRRTANKKRGREQKNGAKERQGCGRDDRNHGKRNTCTKTKHIYLQRQEQEKEDGSSKVRPFPTHHPFYRVDGDGRRGKQRNT